MYVVGEGFGGESAEGGSDPEGSDLVVVFEFGGKGCGEDGVEGFGWELACGDSVDQDGKVGNVVRVFGKWLPVFVSGLFGAWLSSWG